MNYWQHPNNVVLGGRVTADLELKEINANTKMLEFTIANNLKVSGEGQGTDRPNYFRCEAWGKVAEIIQSKFKKGDPIVIIGTLNYNTWQDKESGAKRENTKIRVDTFHFVNAKASSDFSHGDATAPARTVTRSSRGSGEYFYRSGDAPIPAVTQTTNAAAPTWVPGPPDDSDPFKA